MSRALRTARNLRFRISGDGSLRASISKSSGEYTLGLEIVSLLGLLESGVPEKDLAARLRKQLARTLEEAPKSEEMAGLVADLHDAGVLVGEEGIGGGAEDGFGDPWVQWAMIADRKRTLAYFKALRRVVKPGSVVLDVGAGTGVFSAFALSLGAKQVVAIEETAAAATIPQTLSALGINAKNRFTLLSANSADAKIPPGVNVVVSELFGNDPFCEGMLATLHGIFQKVAKGTVALPRAVTVYAEIADLVDGPLVHRVREFVRASENRKAEGKRESDEDEAFLNGFLKVARRTLDFSEVSFAAALGAGDFRRCSAPVALKTFALNPPSAAEVEKCPPATLEMSSPAALPILLLWYRVDLAEGITLSSLEVEEDGSEHWSPIIVPLRRPLAQGESVKLEWDLGEDFSRIGIEAKCGKETLGARD